MDMPSGNWVPSMSAPIKRSRGEMPNGAKSEPGWLNGPTSSPMNTTITAAHCTNKRRLLILRVLSFESFRIKATPTATATTKSDTTM